MNEKILCANTQIVDVDSLVPNPRNPNSHPEKQIAQLAKIIKHQGQRLPIVVSKRSGFIVAGHGRLEAIKSLGWSKCAVDEQEFASDADEYAHMIADNKIAELAEHDDSLMIQQLKDMDFNLDLDLLGMDDFKLPEICEPQCDEDEIPEQVDTRCKRGDVWLLGNHRLMCGDSTMIDDVEKLMNGENADMVFTDPPYGMSAVSKSGVLKERYKTDIMNDDNVDVAKDCFNICVGLNIQKMVFWGANYYSSKLPDSSCWLVWDKNNGQSDQMDCELAWTNLKGVTRQFTKASEKSNRVHPTQKPVELATWCFDKYECKSVLDLFGGSGSTLIACEKTNRKCYMMELDEHYCDVILARWEKYTGKKAERANG